MTKVIPALEFHAVSIVYNLKQDDPRCHHYGVHRLSFLIHRNYLIPDGYDHCVESVEHGA
jgi:hypothetical protein